MERNRNEKQIMVRRDVLLERVHLHLPLGCKAQSYQKIALILILVSSYVDHLIGYDCCSGRMKVSHEVGEDKVFSWTANY